MKIDNSKIQMVDLVYEYLQNKNEFDQSLNSVLKKGDYINGSEVAQFAENFSKLLSSKFVIPCANGTDALQIALMSLNLEQGDEVIVPAFTYAATAEVIGLLKLKPVIVDVCSKTFTISYDEILKAISNKTKAIIPVHLFGQCADMERIMGLAKKNNIFIIEDAAQSIGAEYTFSNNQKLNSGAIGDIGCTSFFPTKNLGCYGDGGAIFSNNKEIAHQIKTIANHGQEKKYFHKVIGINSRLDTIQASILNIKLKSFKQSISARQNVANIYDQMLEGINGLSIPEKQPQSTHTYHQYTILLEADKRDKLKVYLESEKIPTMIYYPLPLFKQEAFVSISKKIGNLENSEKLCKSVLSIPMHPYLTENQQEFITSKIKTFFNKI
jgi:UDP-2-acetamido-2-deoxy-ribo-hexuluronate aminotransferase